MNNSNKKTNSDDIKPEEMIASLQQTYAEELAQKVSFIAELRARYTKVFKELEELKAKNGGKNGKD